MSRPRIRSLKPENWADEAVGAASRDARLLRDVLITYADDDGRWRHLPTAIIGFGYAYDDDVTPAKIKRWTSTLVGVGLVIVYDCDGIDYGCFPTWHLHQVINKYTPSELPPCSDPRVVTREDAARIKKGELPEKDGSKTVVVPPRAPARPSAPFPSCSDAVVVDALASVDDARMTETVEVLRTAPRLTFDLELMGVANTLAAFPNADAVKAAHIAVANASDPNYRTTDAAKALRYAINELDREHRPRSGAPRPAPTPAPKPWDGAIRRALDAKKDAA